MSHFLTTCTFCGVGCGIYLESRNGEITGVYPSVSHPANAGRICVRGWHVHEAAGAADRLRTPLVRRNGVLTEATFEEAYDEIAQRLSAIVAAHGANAVGFLNSASCANEDGYLLQKFARAVIGTNNIDQGTSFYRTTTVETMRRMLGVAAATGSIEDLYSAGTIILNDIDIGLQLPTIGGSIIRAHDRGAKLIVVGPRRHRIAEHADLFLNIRPATECYLYAAMAKIIIDRGLVDLNFVNTRCSGYEAFLEDIQGFDILQAARRCDIDLSLIEEAAMLLSRNLPGTLLFPAGSAELARETLHAMVDLVLISGSLGKTGGGIMPLAEHNNAQGGCDMGVMPHMLPGYVPVTDTAGRREIGRLWQATIPAAPGLDAAAMFTPPSPLRAIWLDRHNPVMSASYRDAAEMLDNMEFVVLQNLFMTRTAEFADVVLPVAAFGEEEVTFTSTERRIQRTARAVEPRFGLLGAWQQMAAVASRMGADWNYGDSRDVLAEIAAAIPYYGGVTEENLNRGYGLQWPCTVDRPLGTPRLFTEGKKQFVFESVRPDDAELAADPDYPFLLSLDHSRYYWHHNTLVRHSETLKREYGILLLDYPDGFIEINDEDAKALAIRDGQRIVVRSSRGEAVIAARVTASVRRGIVSLPCLIPDIMKAIGWDKAPIHHVQIAKAG